MRFRYDYKFMVSGSFDSDAPDWQEAMIKLYKSPFTLIGGVLKLGNYRLDAISFDNIRTGDDPVQELPGCATVFTPDTPINLSKLKKGKKR